MKKKSLVGYIRSDWLSFWKYGRTGKPDHCAIVLSRGKQYQVVHFKYKKVRITIEEIK